LPGAYGAEIVALDCLSCYAGGMTTEIDPIERELLARLRVLECITPRIRAAEAGLCACVTWRADDLGAGEVEIVGMERAG
jgi:hypothetical protein